MPRQRHHYVPEFYQKGFALDNKLWKYDRQYCGPPKHCYPKQNCFEWDLYAIFPPNAPEDRRIETDVLSIIDSQAAEVIRRLEPGYSISRHEMRTLVRFLGLQYTRMPSFSRLVRRTAEVHMDEFLQSRFGTVERAEDALRAVEEQTGEKRNVDAASMVETVKGRRIKAKANETMFLSHMFKHANSFGIWLEHSDWTILVAPKTTGFILCDQPFVSVPPAGTNHESVSFGTPGALSYVPLTKRLCLRFFFGDYGFRYKNVDSRIVRTVNLNLAANSERYIMAADRTYLESVVEKSGSTKMGQGERFTIETLRPDTDNTFIKFVKKPGRYFY